MDTPYKCFLVICSVLIIFSMGLLYSQEQRRPESVFRSFQLEMAFFPFHVYLAKASISIPYQTG